MCGSVRATASSRRCASRISAITECGGGPAGAAAAMLHRLGALAGGSAYRVISAPNALSHRLIQLPLKPVCPVSSTRRPRQNAAMVSVLVMGSLQAPQSQRAGEPDLKIQEFTQAANQHENVLVLRAALRAVGDFQRIAHDGDRQFVEP